MIRPTGHVKEQNIQMLVLMHDLNDPTKNWAFPKEDVLDTLFDHIIEQCDDDDIVTVALGARCLLYTSPSPRDRQKSRMPSSA